ncbi:polyprenyl synthetase family protein [Candidatus Woesearchaeota archaeon]|nr:polyprenyl synthetase family protein [Candidatus Woesearchaeota archaeon]
MNFENSKYVNSVEKTLHTFLPGKITTDWVEKAIGKAKWEQDTEALTKAVSEPVWDFLDRGGKRWRPVLMMVCCEAVGGNTSKILPFTVIPELIHNGTLIIDDIEDNSELRRGKPVLHKRFGVDIAVNAGNAIYFLPYVAIQNSDLPDETKRKAYEIISTQLLKCHFGQAIDIWWHSGKSGKIPTLEEYLQMCADKSGSLACMAAKLGALLGGGTDEQVQALGNFAEAGGVVFQIQDDILNLAENQSIGKEIGDDINEGKRTLLVIHTLNVASEAEKKRLLELLDMHTKDEKLLKEAINIIKKHGSIEYAKKTAIGLAEDALKTIDEVLLESEAKKELRALVKLVLNQIV